DVYAPAAIERLWQDIARNGWDGVLQQQTSARAAARGVWESVTGEKFGSARAAEWRPKEWDGHHLEDVSVEDKDAEIAKVGRELEAAIAATAVDAAQMEALRAEAAELDTRRAALAKAQEEAVAAQSALDDAKDRRGELL